MYTISIILIKQYTANIHINTVTIKNVDKKYRNYLSAVRTYKETESFQCLSSQLTCRF